MLRLEITEVVLVYCNIYNYDYQQDSRDTIVPNNSFCELLDIPPQTFTFPKSFSSEFSYIEISFTDRNSKRLDKEDKINITLVIN